MKGGILGTVEKGRLSLRIKTTLVLFVTAVFLIATLHTVSSLVMLRSFEDLERTLDMTNMARTTALLNERIDTLHEKTADWSNWDDTYQYITDHNEEYTASNLNPSALVMLNINLMAFVDQTGQMVNMILVDLDTEEAVPAPAGLRELILGTPIGHHDTPEDSFSGIITLGDTPIVVSSRPILTNIAKGPVNGALVFGRLIDQSYMDSLSRSAVMNLNLKVLENGMSNIDLGMPFQLTMETPILVEPVSGDSSLGYTLIGDPYGEPVVLLTAQLPREIYQTGKATVSTFVLWSLIMVAFATGISLSLLEVLVVRRLARLSDEVSEVGQQGSGKRVSFYGDDEISDLARSMNRTLETLDTAQQEIQTANTALDQKVQERTAELKTENETNDSILATIPSAVLLVDQTGRVLKANQKLLDLFSINIREQKDIQLVTLPGIEPILSHMSSVLTEKTRCSFDFRYGHNDHQRLIKADLLPIEDRVLVVLRDYTEEHNREERLYLTDRLSSAGEMAAGVAHELNNPLTSIVGLAELALEGHPPQDIEEDLRTISSEAQRAGGIVKNLLSFARKHAPAKQPVQMNKVIEGVLQLRHYEQTINNITVECQLDPELPEVMADYFQMQQVFLNIILNAEQAMLEAHAKGTLKITSEKVDGAVRLSLKDDGPGISPANISKLFSPFFTTKEVGKGTGLGLSICYGIVTAHNGRIYAQSEVGHATTFIVELPT